MCRPLDGIQVHALLVHLPKGRELAQLADLGAQEPDGVVDLLLGGEAPDREADRAVRELVRALEIPQDIRGLESGLISVRARGHRHVLDRHDERLALDEIEADVEVARDAALQVAVDVDLLHVPEAVQQLVAKRADALALGRHLELGEAKRLAHADDLMSGERSGAESPLVPAAVDLRLDAHPGLPAHVLGADALRSVDLVGRHGHQIDLELLQVDLDLACRLHRVAVEDDAFRAANLADLGDRLDHADLVVHHHHRNEDRVGADRRLEFLQDDDAVLLGLKIGRLTTLALELAHGIEHHLVLAVHSDDVLSFAFVQILSAFDSVSVTFGTT